MANVYLQDSTLTAIGNAIRTKAGNDTKLLPSEMAAAITSLPSGGGADELEIIKNHATHVNLPSADNYSAVGVSYGSSSINTAGVLPLSSMGLQGYENFMKNCLKITWIGKPYKDFTSGKYPNYSNSFWMVSPFFGSFNDRYVYIEGVFGKVLSSSSQASLDLTYGIHLAQKSPAAALDTETGQLYNIKTTTSSGGGIVTPQLTGTTFTVMQQASTAYWLKRKS